MSTILVLSEGDFSKALSPALHSESISYFHDPKCVPLLNGLHASPSPETSPINFNFLHLIPEIKRLCQKIRQQFGQKKPFTWSILEAGWMGTPSL